MFRLYVSGYNEPPLVLIPPTIGYMWSLPNHNTSVLLVSVRDRLKPFPPAVCCERVVFSILPVSLKEYLSNAAYVVALSLCWIRIEGNLKAIYIPVDPRA